MNSLYRKKPVSKRVLKIFRGDDAELDRRDGEKSWWRVNGYRVCIHVWTADQWARLEERPADAQYYPCGVWCALRVGD